VALTIDHNTFVISVPKADTTFVSTNALTGYETRSWDELAFMRELGAYLDDPDGMPFDDIFEHNTEVTLAGVVYARTFRVLAPFTVTLENGAYQVALVGGTNNNLSDVLNPNNVSIISANSAGLQSVSSGSGLSASEQTKLLEIWRMLKQDPATPVVTNEDGSITVGAVTINAVTTGTAPNRQTTQTRQ